MKLHATGHGYNYWIGYNHNNKPYYNVTPENQPAPAGGYYGTEYICNIKNVPNLFKTITTHEKV